LSVAQQFYNLRTNPISVGTGTIGVGGLLWQFEAEPTPLSRRYTIELTYASGSSPDVIVRSPDLVVLAEGRRLPHVYQQQPPMLCLYKPGKYEWTAHMRIDLTIVPWTSLWLFYFEDWLTSNEWKGGGEHPTRPNMRARK
jgi:hypothetical protein